MRAPRISVVMSVYNGERHLRASIESILQQSFADFEFVIINDGSTDGSRGILEEYRARDSRVRIIDQSNAGLTAALKTGCDVAVGEFIARHDADDWSAPSRLECLVNLMDSWPAVVMASSWAIYVDDEGEVVDRVERPIEPREATRRLLHERCGPPAHGTMMIRRSAYHQAGGYRTCFYYGQDADLWLRLGLLGLIAYVPQELYHWRLSPEGISGNQTGWQSQFGELGQLSHAARLRGESDDPFVRQAEAVREELLAKRGGKSTARHQYAAAHYRIGTSLSRRGNPTARRHFWSAIRLDPLHWKSWCRLGFEFLKLPFSGSRTPLPSGATKISAVGSNQKE